MKIVKFICSASIVLAVTVGTGCGTPAAKAPDAKAEHKDEHGHEHAHASKGPHDGQIIELGKEEYHAELTHDEATNTVTVYLLDSAAKAAVPIEEKEVTLNMTHDGKPAQFKLPAVPQDGEPAGQSSRFTLSDEKLMEALEAEKATGRLTLSIQGKTYSGSVEHHDHDHDKHEHKK